MRSRDTDDESDNHNVTRKLDLKKTQLNGTRRRPNGARRAEPSVEEEEEDDDSVLRVDAPPPGGDDSMQLVNDSPPLEMSPEVGGGGDKVQKADKPKTGRRGRPPKKVPPPRQPSVESEVSEAPVEQPESDDPVEEDLVSPKRKPGRPAKKAATATGPGRRKRASPERNEQEPESRDNKRQKTQAKEKEPAKKPGPGRGRGRKPKAKAGAPDQDPDASILQVQRGPPLPRARGLVSMRPDSTIRQTRSGRHSYRPLEYWKNERVEYEAGAVSEDAFRSGNRMLLPSIKEVIRVDEEEEEPRRRARVKGRKPKKKAARVEEEDEEDDEAEDWERDMGSVVGDVVLWKPEYEFNPPAADEHVEVMESRLAVSNGAVQTHDIRGTTFQFAKTMNLSFMGAGVVDMPPGSEKKLKNSRKMQMVFFVFRGKVLVSVNETEFRISTGGQWFVPRREFFSFLSLFSFRLRDENRAC